MNTFFTPGPAQLYPAVPQYVQQALEEQFCSISHRSARFQEVFAHTTRQLKELMGVPEDFRVFFHGSATEIWERLLQNCVEEKTFHFVNGSFSNRYFQAARSLQLEAIKAEAEWGEGFDFEKTPVPSDVDLINFTHNETSTGVMTPLEAVHGFRATHPHSLITLDMVSSAPYGQVDWEKVDAAYFSVQKCFGMPAGLGVLILSPACLERARKLEQAGKATGTYHRFAAQAEKSDKNQTVETPNMLGIYVLGKVCDAMLEQGVDALRAETDEKARMLYEYFDNHPRFEPFVNDKAFRSATVVVVDMPADAPELMQFLKERQLVVGAGYGKMKGQQIRIANFPAIRKADVERLLEAIDAYPRS